MFVDPTLEDGQESSESSNAEESMTSGTTRKSSKTPKGATTPAFEKQKRKTSIKNVVSAISKTQLNLKNMKQRSKEFKV